MKDTVFKCLICGKEEFYDQFQSREVGGDRRAFEYRVIDDYSSNKFSFICPSGRVCIYPSLVVVFCRDCFNHLKTQRESIFLSDRYILNSIQQRININGIILKQHTELIQSYREQIKVKRLLKQKKHESIKAS
jgi:hypothetical protein